LGNQFLLQDPFSDGAWFSSQLNKAEDESNGLLLGCFILLAERSPWVVPLGITGDVDCLMGLYSPE